MPIAFGPKLGLLYNANIQEIYWDQFRPFLQAMDQLIMGNVINSTTVVPPASPNAGDAYLILSSPSGAWSTFPVNSIAVWDTEVTLTGTNTRSPAWVNYVPLAGWLVFNVATTTLLLYNGSSWADVGGGGGANFPVNTDITNMTSIGSTTTVAGIAITTAASGPGGITVSGPSGTIALGVSDGVHAAASFTTDGTLTCNGIFDSGQIHCGGLLSSAGVTTDGLSNATPGSPITLSVGGGSTPGNALVISGVSTLYASMLGFNNYPTQTTVGAAGGASALPATPTGYLPISIGGTTFIMPYYAHV